ncbi:MAG: hypothetical protein HN413_07930 [Chloroflexi bacterium]|jgi:hypothetical protein|nr:hypothetical protein [Chloroflexota bacterium]
MAIDPTIYDISSKDATEKAELRISGESHTGYYYYDGYNYQPSPGRWFLNSLTYNEIAANHAKSIEMQADFDWLRDQGVGISESYP